MAKDESELTLSQAKLLALSGLAEHWPEDSLGLAEGKTMPTATGSRRGSVAIANGVTILPVAFVVTGAGVAP